MNHGAKRHLQKGDVYKSCQQHGRLKVLEFLRFNHRIMQQSQHPTAVILHCVRIIQELEQMTDQDIQERLQIDTWVEKRNLHYRMFTGKSAPRQTAGKETAHEPHTD
jgi:hypothetical protein